MNQELAKTLTTALVQFIDRERPEGSMCCSNAECANLENAFSAENFHYVELFAKRRLSELTEFEKCLLDFADARDEYEFNSTKVAELNDKVIELTKSYAKKLLELAKKELFHHGEGTYFYYKDGSVDFIDPMPIRTPVAVPNDFYPLRPACYEPGGTCTNPQMDCINCPRRNLGGSFSTSSSSGTSTLKAEE